MRKIIALLFFFIILSSIYSNTLHSSWHFDDLPNISNNYYLHLTTLDTQSIINSWYSDPKNPFQLNNKLYRPVACMSFALNWYFGQNNVFGYHIINILIHILTAFFLYLFILNLFKSPNFENKYNNIHFIAFLTALLWAVNPIQTQAVTYIVQRMALLAAMFYILGLYAYIKSRNNHLLLKKILWIAGCLIFYLLAVGSKENAAIMPIAILLIEALFFQNLENKNAKYIFLWIALGISLLFIFFCSLYFLNGAPLSFLKGYLYRPFTFTERLLAEFRIIVFYLYQIFYPIPGQFSITHDVIISKSIFTPWTTIPSILLIISLIGIAITQVKKNPLVSFSIIFYFLNHIIESTVIPLELIFEHRNYLPSFFLFLPIAIILNKIFVANKNNYLVFIMISIVIVTGTTAVCYSTFVRNKVWVDDKTLWNDAMIKAPNSARPINNIAIELAWGDESKHPKRYDLALVLFEKALDKYQPRKYLKAGVYGNMASVYSNNKHDYKTAMPFYKKALEIHPKNLKIRHDMTRTLILQGDFQEALKNVDILIRANNKNEVYHNLKGFILLWLGNYADALSSLKKAFRITPNKTKVLINIGVALNRSNHHKEAELLLLKANKNSPRQIMIYFYLIENSINAKDKTKTDYYINQLFTLFNLSTIKQKLTLLSNQHRYPPVSKEIISPLINNILNGNHIEVTN